MALTQSEKDRLKQSINTYGIDKVKEQIKSTGRAGELLDKAYRTYDTTNTPVTTDYSKPVDYTGLADTGTSNVFTNEKGTLTTGVTDLTTPPLPEPTVATKDNAIVDKGTVDTTKGGLTDNVNDNVGGTSDTGDTDIRVTKLGEVLSDAEKRALKDKELERIRNLKGISFEERNKMFQKLNEDVASGQFYGGETLLNMQQQQANEAQRQVQDQTTKALSDAETLFRQQLEKDTARIREQGQKVMDTTQRLNSLRGGGRSSANEADIMKQQTEINGLISAAQQQSDLKLQERKMQIEGASAEAMAGIQNALAANTKLVNEKVAEALKKQSEINSDLKTTFEESFDNTMGLLGIAGEDTTQIDKDASEKQGFLVNKDGTFFKTKGGKGVKFNGNAVDPEIIDGYVSSILTGEKLSSVPTEDRGAVVKALAARRKADGANIFTLTPLMKLQAAKIAKDLLGGTSEDNVAAVEALFLEGKDDAEIRAAFNSAGFNEETPKAYKNALGNLVIEGFTKDQKEGITAEYQNRLEKYGANSPEVNEYLLAVAGSGLDVEDSKKINAKISTINAIADIQKSLDKYIAAGGNTDILTGNIENISNKVLGETGNKDLAEIATKIQLAIQAYRQGISGASFTESEAKEYESIFPSGSKSISLNKAKMDALIDSFSQYTNDFYRKRIGASSYDVIFPNGVLGTINPGLKGIGGPTDFSSIDVNDSMSEDEIINSLGGGKGTGSTFDPNSSDEDIYNFIGGGGTSSNIDFSSFNKADQTAVTKETPVVGKTDFTSNIDIQKRHPNEASFKNNNPTGLTWGISKELKSMFDKAGVNYSLGTARPKNEGGNYIKFASVQDGIRAYKLSLTQRGDDVYKRLYSWSAGGGRDTAADIKEANKIAYANKIMKGAGIQRGTKFSELNKEQLNKLMALHLQKESPAFYKEIIKGVS